MQLHSRFYRALPPNPCIEGERVSPYCLIWSWIEECLCEICTVWSVRGMNLRATLLVIELDSTWIKLVHGTVVLLSSEWTYAQGEIAVGYNQCSHNILLMRSCQKTTCQISSQRGCWEQSFFTHLISFSRLIGLSRTTGDRSRWHHNDV